jgi:hypothetical protein
LQNFSNFSTAKRVRSQRLDLRACLVCLDDFIGIGGNFKKTQQSQEGVPEVKRSPTETELREMYKVYRKEVRSLRHDFLAAGGNMKYEKMEDVKNWPSPIDNHQPRSFLVLCTYYKSYIT